MGSVKIIDRGLDRIILETRKFRWSYTKVGLPANGSPGESDGGDMRGMADNVMVGAIHEFGAPKANIPERSWLRSAFDKNLPKIGEVVQESYASVVDGRASAKMALAKLGEWFTGRVKTGFADIKSPPYAESTLKARRRKGAGDMNPQMLVDTGQLRNSVQHVEVMRG